MAKINLTLKGITSPEDLNAVTTALMMLNGVDSVDVAREWAEIEGNAKRSELIQAVAKLKRGISAE